jgi:alpha-beta hydrolase superfamily lysophospholipase
VTRTPFYLESRQQWLFAWLHRREHACSDHGVILCPPLGHEQIHAHRSLRHLADEAAQAGFAVLRLDYHGSGDSAGTEEEPDRHATWLANLRDAQAWMREQLGCRRLTLVGLRLGAALAVQAAAAESVDGLLLWAPVVKGRAYARKLKFLSLTAGSAPATPGDIEAAGFVLTEQTAQELSRLDLLKTQPRCRRALIMARDDTSTDTALLEHLTALGIEAEQATQPGYADMMAEPHFTQVPCEAIACAVAWLLAGDSGEACGAVFGENAWPAQAILSHQPAAGSPLQPATRIRERVLHVSRQPELFGILTEPSEAPPGPLPFLVFLNGGSCYRVGPNRLYVSLNRELAGAGFRCLRLDLCGLGDSVSPDPERENDPYPATAFRDIDLTLNHLRAQLGAERVVLLGLCSGAYAAFQSAAWLVNPVLVESVLINPLTFYWREGMPLDTSPAAQLQSYRACLRSVWHPGKWLKLLAGRSKLGLGGVVRMLVDRWRQRNRAGRATLAAPGDVPLTHPAGDDLPGDLERIARAGRQLACFFAQSDPGHALLTYSALRKVNELCTAGRLSVQFIEDADHTFSRRGPRRALVRAITQYLSRRYLPAAGA